MTKLTVSNVKLTIDGEEVQGFAGDTVSMRLEQIRLKRPVTTTYIAPSEGSARLWFTLITTNYGNTLYVTWTKPTKRQLRKWCRKVRSIISINWN